MMSTPKRENATAGASTPPSQETLPHNPISDRDEDDIEADEFGEEMNLDDDLESILRAAESQVITSYSMQEATNRRTGNVDMDDVEDLVPISPFLEFRRKGWLSVSDLVGTVWCEVQVSDFLLIACTCHADRGYSMTSEY